MNARTRQVFPRQMVAHLWANRSQDSARDGQGNFYFTGRAIFSWGSHFVIAAHVDTCDGARILWNDSTYSMSTSRHQYIARRALSASQHAHALDVPSFGDNELRGRDWLLRMATATARAAGESFAAAAEMVRASAKRERAVSKGQEYAATARTLAETVARGVGDAKDASAIDKQQARALLRVLAKIPAALATMRDPKTQREAYAAAAGLLGRDELREKLDRFVNEARRQYGLALGYEDAQQWTDAEDAACASINAARAARDFAKRHKMRAGKMPNADEIAARVESYAAAMRDEHARYNATRYLYDAERYARNLIPFAHNVHWYVETNARNACDAISLIPSTRRTSRDAYIAERADTLRRRYDKKDAVAKVLRDLRGIAQTEITADSYIAAPATHYADARSMYARALATLDSAAHVLPPRMPVSPAGGETVASYVERSRVRIAEKLASVETILREREASRIGEWRNGSSVRPSWELGPLLRLSADGSRIETSHGAEVPVKVAPLLWRLCNAARASGEARTFTGEDAPRLGHFTLSTVRADGSIVAGCHDIAWSELVHIAECLGYTNNGANAQNVEA